MTPKRSALLGMATLAVAAGAFGGRSRHKRGPKLTAKGRRQTAKRRRLTAKRSRVRRGR